MQAPALPSQCGARVLGPGAGADAVCSKPPAEEDLCWHTGPRWLLRRCGGATPGSSVLPRTPLGSGYSDTRAPVVWSRDVWSGGKQEWAQVTKAGGPLSLVESAPVWVEIQEQIHLPQRGQGNRYCLGLAPNYDQSQNPSPLILPQSSFSVGSAPRYLDSPACTQLPCLLTSTPASLFAHLCWPNPWGTTNPTSKPRSATTWHLEHLNPTFPFGSEK